MARRLVTSYPTPDIDGIACIVAYSEFLDKQGKQTIGASFGEPDPEAEYLLDELDITVPEGEKYLENSDVILTDASFPDGVSDKIDLEDIIEVIDHRKNHEANKFPNAKVQVELVGAAATLIAEKFKQSSTEISKESATLLYAAIRDNTVDFQANVKTQRDREMADWLKKQADIDEETVGEIFEVKSDLDRAPKKIIPDDYYNTTHYGKRIGVSQIEALNAENFTENNKTEIRDALRSLKNDENLDFAFLTSIDINQGKNIFIAADEKSAELLEAALDIEFENLKAEKGKMLLRKEIMPEIKEELRQ